VPDAAVSGERAPRSSPGTAGAGTAQGVPSSGLQIDALGIAVERFAAVPTLAIGLRLTNLTGSDVHAVVLRAQVRIEPGRRTYDDGERLSLLDLFGPPEQWAASLHPFLWTELVTSVGAFQGTTEITVPMTCTYDLEVAAARYLQGLSGGSVPLVFLFSGTVFRVLDRHLSVQPVPWHLEARICMPLAVWREAMDRFYPGSGWIRLPTGTIDALGRYKASRGLPTWDDAVGALLRSVEDRAS